MKRRVFVATSAGLGALLLAGCSGGDSSIDAGGGRSTTASSSHGATKAAGTFRLLISDEPAAINDFDELNVAFDRARIFPSGDADDNQQEVTETELENETESDGSDGGDQRGFFVIDLDGATVDLTQVKGEKAISVFDGELSAGRYTKIELYAASVEGFVDGDPVDVKIPSEKLQIVKPFEVVEGETLTFVFDINVVKKGQTGGYNLLPVISKSGVAGHDIEVNESGNANRRGRG